MSSLRGRRLVVTRYAASLGLWPMPSKPSKPYKVEPQNEIAERNRRMKPQSGGSPWTAFMI